MDACTVGIRTSAGGQRSCIHNRQPARAQGNQGRRDCVSIPAYEQFAEKLRTESNGNVKPQPKKINQQKEINSSPPSKTLLSLVV